MNGGHEKLSEKTLTMIQVDEVSWMHHCVPGIHLEVSERAGELVVCCQSVEYWRDGCHVASGDSVSNRLHLGTPQRAGEEGEDPVRALKCWWYLGRAYP